MRPSALALLLISPVAVFAQTTVQGRVASRAGESIIAATVIFTGAGTTRTAATDSAGQFIFHDVVRGPYRLRVESIGYLPLQRDIMVRDNSLVSDFQLMEAPVSIEAVTVEGRRQRARFQNQAGGLPPAAARRRDLFSTRRPNRDDRMDSLCRCMGIRLRWNLPWFAQRACGARRSSR